MSEETKSTGAIMKLIDAAEGLLQQAKKITDGDQLRLDEAAHAVEAATKALDLAHGYMHQYWGRGDHQQRIAERLYGDDRKPS